MRMNWFREIIASNDNKEEKGEAEDNVGVGSKKHICDTCSRSYDHRQHLVRHQMVHSGIKFPCFGCSSQFSRKDKLNKHVKERHPELQGNINVVQQKITLVTGPTRKCMVNTFFPPPLGSP